MTEASTQVDDGLLASKASASSAAYQHQMNAAAALGRARGVTQRHTPAVVYDNTRDWMASRHAGLLSITSPDFLLNWRGLRSASLSRISHWPFPSLAADRRVLCSSRGIRRYSPARAVTGCAGAFHSVRFSDCRPSALNTCRHQRLVNNGADRPHLSIALSNSASSAGSKYPATRGQKIGNAGQVREA